MKGTDPAVLVNKMKKGVVHFKYYKKDNTVRKAYGTLSTNIIPLCDREELLSLIEATNALADNFKKCVDNVEILQVDPDGVTWCLDVTKEALKPFNTKTIKERKKDPNVVVYYDIEKQGFRRFNKDKLI